MTQHAIHTAGAAPSVVLDVVNLRSARAGPYTFTLCRGACLVVSGPSGVGKSRLLRMIADLDACSGEIALHGVPRSAIFAPSWRRQVVYQSAEPAWWAATVREHFQSDQIADAQALMVRLNLPPESLDADLARLSTGERQRLALIRSLLCKPSALLLDEPTGALDQMNAMAVEAVIQAQLQAGLALILVTHSIAQADRLGTQRMHLSRMP